MPHLPAELRGIYPTWLNKHNAPIAARGEALHLRVFIDRSVLEVFANNRQCITQRIYPVRSDSVGVVLFSCGGATDIKSFEAWQMGPSLF